MRKLLMLSLIWLLLMTPALSQARDPGNALSRALSDLNAGRVFEGVEGLSQIVREDPAASSAYFYLSVIYADMGQLELARELLERALASDPDEGKFHYQMGVILYYERNWVAALDALQDALGLGMGNEEADAWRNIGDVQLLLLEREAALAAYETAVRLRPDDARNRLALGQFYLSRNALEQALDHLWAAVELDPGLGGVHANLGLALRRNGNPEAAVETLKRGIEINPADQTSRYALAQSLMAIGREDEAQALIETYRQIEDSISRANAALDRGTEYFDAGNLAAARRLLEEAVDLAPSYSAAQRTLGEVLLAAGEPEEALVALQHAVAANPLNAGAYFSLGAARHLTGQLEAALEATRRAIVLDDGDARFQRQLGEILLQLGRETEARTAYENAARIALDRVD